MTYGQGTIAMPVFNHLTVKDGLRETTNAFIFQHSDGHIWISSLDEIHWYDGNRVFQLSDRYPGAARIENVQSPFFEDLDRNVWFCTTDRLYRFDYCSEQFTSFYMTGPGGDTLKENYQILVLEKDSILWASAEQHLFRINVRTGVSKNFGFLRGPRFGIDTTNAGRLEKIFVCPWILRDGIDVVEIGKDSIITTSTFFHQPTRQSPALNLSGALVENDSLVWLFADKGLIAFNPRAPGRSKKYFPEGIQLSRVRNGVHYGDRFLLVSIVREGLWLFDKQERSFVTSWPHDPNNPHSPSTNNSRDIYKDRQGNFWISQPGIGVDFFTPGQIKFRNYLSKHPHPQNTKQVMVTSLVEGPGNSIWCSTNQDGIILFNKDQRTLIDTLRTTLRPPLRRVDQLLKDQAGNIWVLAGDRILRYLSRQQRWEKIITDSEEFFITLMELPDTSMMAATLNGPKILFEFKGSWDLHSLTGEDAQPMTANLGAIFMDRHHNIYAAYEQDDLRIYRLEGYRMMEKKRLDLESMVLAFMEDHNRNCIWIGTNEGLFQLFPETFRLVHYDESHGLDRHPIYGIRSDDDGHLWLSTNRGLIEYIPERKSYHQYHAEEGLQSNEFSRFSTLRTSDGRLWFGGPNGLNGFHPASVEPYPFPPQVVIENLEVNNQLYALQDCRDETPAVELKYWQNTLSFELHALCQYLPQYNRLRYRITGYNHEWTETGPSAVVNLFRLPPGEYTLEVMAANANNIHSRLKTMTVHISPPFWQTTWFRVLALIALGAMIYGGVQLYIRRQLHLKQIEIDRQNALQAERNRIASELHDDLGSGLSVIRYLSEHARRQESGEAQRSQIERISQSSRSLIEKMGEIIWAMNSENDQLENLLYHLQDYSEDYLADNSLDCRYHLPAGIPDMEISGERRRNILLTVKETLHNIVKHAGARQVSIDITVTDRLSIRIQDDGSGIDFDRIRRGGNGLKNMQKRMQAMGGDFHIFNEHGTVVQLNVPLNSET